MLPPPKLPTAELVTSMDIRTMDVVQLLQRRKRLRRELLEQKGLRPLRIAVLGATTTSELTDLLELLLLADGFQPEFLQSEYNKYFEDAVLDPARIRAFKPDLVYIHTHFNSARNLPGVTGNKDEYSSRLKAESERFRTIWQSLHENVGCQIIQNNFESPPLPALGNFDAVSFGGTTRFLNELNLEFARAASDNPRLTIHDLNAVAARIGLNQWFDWSRWHNYKILTTPEGSLALARSLTAIIGAMLGRAKKCLVLDLDNTLWGGVIGDDGLDKIQIGRETPVAEAYTAFQEYCLRLRDRGVLLAVCSKNEDEIARSGFTHPDSVLKLEHFSAFKANWSPKHENIRDIARQLNLGLDSFVFVDDNPAERAIVAAQLPAVAVPDMGDDITLYPARVQSGMFFETLALSREDTERAATYAANAAREESQGKFADYGEYLASLQMHAEIDGFRPVYLERIAQLINKTNQFNLTTRRYTFAEVGELATSANHVTLYGKLTDMFGDNGLISVVVGALDGTTLNIDLWLMSCRVLKRDMELAMLDLLAERASAAGATRLVGRYLRTAKNAMVADHYEKLGFTLLNAAADGSSSEWELEVAGYRPQTRHIKIQGTRQ